MGSFYMIFSEWTEMQKPHLMDEEQSSRDEAIQEKEKRA